QRADKNTDTRITLPSEKACSIWFFATTAVTTKALRCGDTPLSGVPIRVKHNLSHLWQFSRVGAFMTPHTPLPVLTKRL
ncbi:hypothetical protein O6V14_10995, partial [Sphingomonas faeni]|uniref:hypothetical protein n=1 Tax=Sphingomonas faeni TaxID=185950 RepID=UPI00335FABFB